MPLRINTNSGSISAQRFLTKNQRQVEDSFKALSSGSRLNTPQNDASGFAISELLRGQVAGIGQSLNNARFATAMIQTAEGAMNEQNNILIRMRELAVSSASDNVGDSEREHLDNEFQLLISEFDRIAKATRFGSNQLLAGSNQEYSFQVGPYAGEENVIEFKLDGDTQASTIGIDGLDITDQDTAIDVLEDLDNAVTELSGNRAKFGAAQSRFVFATDNLEVQRQNVEEARSIIADVDVAEETSKLARAQVLNAAGMAVLAQANQYPHTILKLLG